MTERQKRLESDKQNLMTEIGSLQKILNKEKCKIFTFAVCTMRQIIHEWF